MPPETLTRETAGAVRQPQVSFAPGEPGGTLAVHPAFADAFARAGLTASSALLDLPGEVVSGHPDRHVARVEVPGAGAFYLKRQHVVGWREKLRNRFAGFAWASRCEREASLLQALEVANLPAPRWAAFGAVGRRAFLLVEEVPDSVDLRRLLSDGSLSHAERRRLAANLGAAVAAVHAAGFTTPDLTAKHVLVNPRTLAVTFLDWQSSTRGRVSRAARADALGALHASLAEPLASRTDRARVLRAYCAAFFLTSPREGEVAGTVLGSGGWGVRKNRVALPPHPSRSQNRPRRPPPHGGRSKPRAASTLLNLILRAAPRHAGRRSVRDQLRPDAPAQRLVWLAGEAVCAVPEVAAAWPRPAVAPPFYGPGPDGASHVRFDGREAVLVRGRTFAPFGRLCAWLRATPWRSPGVTVGRVLFHLQRYGVPAPRLLAFGQRLVSSATAEWFALYEAPPGVSLREWQSSATAERRAALAAVTECLRKLHDAGCVLADVAAAFALDGGRVLVADPRAVRIVRRVRASARRRDLHLVARLLGVA